jgi:hypothetical protein
MMKIFHYGTFDISKSLHNYFIMHDIKYFFSIKIIKQSRGKIFLREHIMALSKSIIF